MIETHYINGVSKKSRAIANLFNAVLNNQGKSGVLEVMKTSARYYNKNVGIHYAFTFYDAATLIHLTFLPSKRVTYNFTVESSVRSMPYKEFNNLAQAQSYIAKFLE